MKKLAAFLGGKHPLRISLVGALVLTVILIVIDQIIAPGDIPGIVEYEVAGSTARALEILGLWGEAGRTFFLRTVWLDYLYPLAYSALLAGALAKARNTTAAWFWPLLACLTDGLENAGLIHSALVYPNLSENVVTFTAVFAGIKFFSLIISVGLLMGHSWRGTPN